jgi:hypothetical protein
MHGRLSWQGLIAEQLARDPMLVERRQMLRRTLRGLSGHQLEALSAGLERHGDQLVTGRLFKASSGGGCAVGVMLRELDAVSTRGAAGFWLRDRWRRSARSYPAIRREPRLRHLEWGFDAAVQRLRAGGVNRTEAVAAVGRWLHELAGHELAWRAQTSSLSAAASPAVEAAARQGQAVL